MTEFVWTLSEAARFGTAVALGSFAVFVGKLAGFRGPAKAYAIFGAGFGIAVALGLVALGLLPPIGERIDGPAQYWAAAALLGGLAGFAVWQAGIARLLVEYGGRAYLWVGWVGAAIGLASAGPVSVEWLTRPPQPTLVNISAVFYTLALLMTIGWMAAAPVVMALARRRRHQPGQAILAAAMAAYPIAYPLFVAVSVGTGRAPGWDSQVWYAVPAVLAFVATVAAWSFVPTRGSRAGLAVISVAGVFLSVGVLLGLYAPAVDPASLARAFDILLVAYAILRLQYLGIDVKLRFAISKSAIAATILATIFLVSEGAQVVFGGDQQWVGLLAGAAVVFAIAPLQRAADRLAAKAVPMSGTGGPGLPGPEAAYLEALHAAYRDGHLTRREERHLARAADHLGISAARALELREQAEKATG